MKTVGVGLILALNIGTDPPDITKPDPCAHLQCWMDPGSVSRSRAKEMIGERLEAQYARWQQQKTAKPLKYRRVLDPTVEDVRTLCMGLRRQAKNERVLLHYNGHGVPRPTANGEIWVFDKNHTQYIPLSVTDLRLWVGQPSILVFDCSSAGVLMPYLSAPMEAHGLRGPGPTLTDEIESFPGEWVGETIILCATSEQELLPMHPDYPADIFTSCLTTPIQMALHWFIHRNRQSMQNVDPEIVNRIPGKANDRKTPLGELNWVFTAVTDSIAWDMLPTPLFQRLFRQDLMVASMFRNFLLADRILRSLNCSPVSYPPLPRGVCHHPLWEAWDLACESCICSLISRGVVSTRVHRLARAADKKDRQQTPAAGSEGAHPSGGISVPFFSEQLTAFEVWLEFARVQQGSGPLDDVTESPKQLPIVLQVLLSQAHRIRALNLLNQFLDLGPWAVNLALSLGIFPYVLKLLQSPEYKKNLVGIWARILAFDPSCQVDLLKDGALSHFIQHMTWGLDESDSITQHTHKWEATLQRTAAAFVVSAICRRYVPGQKECLKQKLPVVCCSLLSTVGSISTQDGSPMPPVFRRWLCICIGNLVEANEGARKELLGVDIHVKLFERLRDSCPRVRATACYALGSVVGANSPSTVRAKDSSPSSTRLNPVSHASHPNHRGYYMQQAGRPFQLTAVGGAPRVNSAENKESPGPLDSHPLPIGPLWVPEPRGGFDMDKQRLQDHSGAMKAADILLHRGEEMINALQDDRQCEVDEVIANCLLASFEEDGSPIARYEAMISLSCVVDKYLLAFWVLSMNVGQEGTVKGGQATMATWLDDHKFSSRVSRQRLQAFAPAWRSFHRFARSEPHPALRSLVVSIVDVINLFREERERASKPTGQGRSQARRPGDFSEGDFNPDQSTLPYWQYNHKPVQQKVAEGQETEFRKPLLRLSSLFEWERGRLHVDFNERDSLEDDFLGAGGAVRASRGRRIMATSMESSRLTTLPPYPSSLESMPSIDESRLTAEATIKQGDESDDESFKKSLELKQKCLFRNTLAETTTILDFHPYEEQVAVCDGGDGISIWNLGDGKKVSGFANGSRNSRFTSSCWVNEDTLPLFVVGCDDGSVKVWGELVPEYAGLKSCPCLMSAFIAVPALVRDSRGSGLVLNWQQHRGHLVAGGNSNKIFSWDVEVEKCVSGIATGSEACVTSMTTLWSTKLAEVESGNGFGPGVVVAGFGDGAMKLFDFRQKDASAVTRPSNKLDRFSSLTEHDNWVVSVSYTGWSGYYKVQRWHHWLEIMQTHPDPFVDV